MNDDPEIGAELHRIAGKDPLDPLNPQHLLARGRRGRRRRRVISAAGVTAAVTAVALAATLLPNIGQAGRDGAGPVAGDTSTAQPDFTPLPGVPRGDDGVAMTQKEADRRCALRTGVNKPLAKYALPILPGETLGHASEDGSGMPTGPECNAPGDSRPTDAVIAKAKKDPMPTDAAGQLRNCSVLFWHDMSKWKVVTSDRQEDGGVSLVALSPSGRYFADCRLSATFDPDAIGQLGSGPRIWSVSLHARQPMTYFATTFSKCSGPECVGALFADAGRVASNIAKIQLKTKNGRTHDIKVIDGWYALSWADGYPSGGSGVTVTAYDKNGKVVGRR